MTDDATGSGAFSRAGAGVTDRSAPGAPTTRAISGKRVILVMLVLIAAWGIVLAVLVWRTARAPHHARIRDAPAERTGAR
jgi:hypothetical protein